MYDLKSFLWNSKSVTSTKNRYKYESFQLTEWPDFGHVGCPGDYIILSAYLVKRSLNYQELKSLTTCSTTDLNHFLYVCKMLQILNIEENQYDGSIGTQIKRVSNEIGRKLKSFFFTNQLV